ncbi:prepilin-type N-terminal cleavage/methylation domain-containing protein [bacterium]|nr:prepilin-type N-terminal cleavage/methylation domain-containing protein [bacterium]
MSKRGFTMAEILIAMAIIGIVAALTLPSLSEAYKKRVLTTQLQKAYAELSQAGTMVIANEMTQDFRQSNAIKDLEFVGKYLAVAKRGKDFASSYNDVWDTDRTPFKNIYTELMEVPAGENTDNYYRCGVTKSGAAVCIDKRGIGILDINGKKAPNTLGRDAFTIGFRPDGTVNANYSRTLDSIIYNDWNIDKPKGKIIDNN